MIRKNIFFIIILFYYIFNLPIFTISITQNTTSKNAKINLSYYFKRIKKKKISIHDFYKLNIEQINTRNTEGDTFLTYAIQVKNYKLAKQLLNTGINIFLKNYKGETALILAAKRNYSSIIKKLILYKADIFKNDFLHHNAFEFIIINKNKKIFQNIIKKNPNILSSFQIQKILLSALKNINNSILKFLLKYKISLITNTDITNKIIIYSYVKKNRIMIKWLKKNNYRKNKFIKKQILLQKLIQTIRQGSYKKLKYLLKQRLKVNQQEKLKINKAVVYFINYHYNYYKAILLYNELNNFAFQKNESWLNWSAFLKKNRLIKYIMRKEYKNKNLCKIDNFGNNAFHWASTRKRNFYITKQLKKICNYKIKYDLSTIIHKVIQLDRVDILKEILSKNTFLLTNKISFQDKKHSLLYIAFYYKSNQIIDFLLNQKKEKKIYKIRNWETNNSNNEYEELLYQAVIQNKIQYLEQIRSSKKHIDSQAVYKALKFAICMGEKKYSTYLEKYFMHYPAHDKNKANDILLCTAKSHSIHMLLHYLPKTKSLIKNDISGSNILDYMASYGYKNIIQKMFQIDKKLKDNKYTTKALFYAAENNQFHILRYLIELGAVVNGRNLKKETPLFLAVKNNNYQSVQELIIKNAYINIKDNFHKTPLYYAQKQQNKDIEKLLLLKGAKLE